MMYYSKWEEGRNDPKRIETLKRYRYAAVIIGITHTFLTAGIVFGWSSLESILIREGLFSDATSQFTVVFTAGAIGNYLSNLPCGTVLDRYGPRVTGIMGSIGFGIGIYLCSLASRSSLALEIGFFMLGFFGPCSQLPTLHLSCLFPEYSAAIMSMQAAAFDGGSVIFYLMKLLYKSGVGMNVEFYCYLLVPLYIFVISLCLWSDMTMENNDEPENVETETPSENQPLISNKLSKSIEDIEPVFESVQVLCMDMKVVHLKGATLRQILKSPQFLFLMTFTAVHILKLNFIVDSIDEQLVVILPDEAESLIWTFGWMLPLGFFIMPVSSYLLKHKPIYAFQLANLFGVVYGFTITIPVKAVQLYLTFPLVALSRQLVYSIVFHCIAELFGFLHFGQILGIINLAVGLLGCLQYPIVSLAESADSWAVSDYILALLSLPLFSAPFFVVFRQPKKRGPGEEDVIKL